MGQKANPISNRLGIIRSWDSRWFTSKASYAEFLHEDVFLRDYVKRRFHHAGIAGILIERAGNRCKITISTSFAPVEFLYMVLIEIVTEFMQHCFLGLIFCFAVRTDKAHEALRYNEGNGRSYQVRLKPYIQQARNCCNSAVGVKRRKYQVASERRAERNFSRILIPDFSNEYYVRILPENRT